MNIKHVDFYNLVYWRFHFWFVNFDVSSFVYNTTLLKRIKENITNILENLHTGLLQKFKTNNNSVKNEYTKRQNIQNTR